MGLASRQAIEGLGVGRALLVQFGLDQGRRLPAPGDDQLAQDLIGLPLDLQGEVQLTFRLDASGAKKVLHRELSGEVALGLRPIGIENDVLNGFEDDDAYPIEKERPL